MKSFTDLFIRRPVLAIVVSLVIIIAGIQAWRSLTIRQYPRSENASVVVSTVYVGASADLVRGFVTTPLEQAIASADGIDYIESKSLLGFSMITARLKLNFDQTKALADITAKVNQVRQQPARPRPRCLRSAWSRRIRRWRGGTLGFLRNPQSIGNHRLSLAGCPTASFSVSGRAACDILGARIFAMARLAEA